MRCCLSAPSNYLYQCWLLLGEVKLHSTENKLTLSALLIIPYNNLCINHIFKIPPHLPDASGIRAWIARSMGPAWGPSGSCRPQVGPCSPHEPCYLGSSSAVINIRVKVSILPWDILRWHLKLRNLRNKWASRAYINWFLTGTNRFNHYEQVPNTMKRESCDYCGMLRSPLSRNT